MMICMYCTLYHVSYIGKLFSYTRCLVDKKNIRCHIAWTASAVIIQFCGYKSWLPTRLGIVVSCRNDFSCKHFMIWYVYIDCLKEDTEPFGKYSSNSTYMNVLTIFFPSVYLNILWLHYIRYTFIEHIMLGHMYDCYCHNKHMSVPCALDSIICPSHHKSTIIKGMCVSGNNGSSESKSNGTLITVICITLTKHSYTHILMYMCGCSTAFLFKWSHLGGQTDWMTCS